MWTGSLPYPPSLLYSPPCPYHHNHFSGAITTFKVSEQKIIFGNKPECIAIILATHRQLPSWLTKPTFQGRWNFLVLLCRSSRPNSRPAHTPKPFRRLTNLLGMSQETWAISWGIYVFTDGYVCPSVCFTLRQHGLLGTVPQCSQRQWFVSKLALGRSSVYQAENSRKDETKNPITLQWKVMLMQQFPLDILHSLIYYLSFFKFYPLYSLKDVGMLVAIFFKVEDV